MQLIRCLLSKLYLNMFRHHYAHHQENKTVSYRMRCSALVVLAVFGCGLMELRHEPCALCESYCSTFTQCTLLTAQLHKTTQPTTAYTPRQNTACSRTRSYSPDDGHNDARNMLR